jgi:hypothetical protein
MIPLLSWRSPLLGFHVRALRLRQDAPFPSQLKDRARRFLRLRLVGR